MSIERVPEAAISIRQPWAWAILNASVGKATENRDWATPYRGRVVIHTGLKLDKEGVGFLEAMGHKVDPATLPMGAFIGEAEIWDCVPFDEERDKADPWAFGPFLWRLRNPVAYTRPLSAKGRLGFFGLPIWFEDLRKKVLPGS